jgi:hypothetical protein
VNVTEEILQQFARRQGPGGVIKGVAPETDLPQGDSFLLERPDEGSRGSLQAVHAKVIGKRPSQAFQKGIEVRNEITIFIE